MTLPGFVHFVLCFAAARLWCVTFPWSAFDGLETSNFAFAAGAASASTPLVTAIVFQMFIAFSLWLGLMPGRARARPRNTPRQ
jgi:hypothetical protein